MTGVQAASLTMVRDVIVSSQIATSTDHTIEFTATNAVPTSGTIVLTPEAGFFTIPASFDYTDVDLLISSGGSYTNRSLAASASTGSDGVNVVTGTSGSITITLNSTTGIQAGEQIRILLGENATHEEVGDTQLVNPNAAGSYRFHFQTNDQTSARIDQAETRIAVLEPVSVGATVEETSPVRSNGLPSGEISHGNSTIEISLNTNETANCRYATTTDVLYSAMTGIFSTTNSTIHAVVLSGHENGTSYNYYVRCIDESSFANDDDYAISFNLEDTPTVQESTGQTTGGASGGGGAGGGGAGAFPGGSQNLYLASVGLSGFTSPFGRVVLLKDGEEVVTVTANGGGAFSGTVDRLERGAYSFSAYALDSQNRKSSLFSSTLSVEQGTNNVLSNIIMAPTVVLSSTEIGIGESVTISGEAIPGSTVEVFVKPQELSSLGDAQKYVVTVADGESETAVSGVWETTISTGGLPRGTYEVRAKVIHTTLAESALSATTFLGIGEAPSPDFAVRADINGDAKVNLIDFSILLTFWGTAHEPADLNLDGSVTLADFSILLFNWTG